MCASCHLCLKTHPNAVPSMVSLVPPAVPPLAGDTDVILAVLVMSYVYPLVIVAFVKVSTTSTSHTVNSSGMESTKHSLQS